MQAAIYFKIKVVLNNTRRWINCLRRNNVTQSFVKLNYYRLGQSRNVCYICNELINLTIQFNREIIILLLRLLMNLLILIIS